jgi:hypothetical protein
MPTIRNLTGALLVAGFTCAAYAAVPPTTPTDGYAVSAPQQQQDDTKPKQDDAKPTTDKNAAKAPKPGEQPVPSRPKAGQPQPKENRNQPAAAGPKGQAAGGSHGRISDRDYQAHFSRQHTFSVRTVVTTTRIVPNQTQFAYGGYTFVFLEPWPAGWVLTDDCYIDYIDGEYVLIDLAHPGMQITLSIVG